MFHVDSEVGRLRQVVLHRPDLELKRLTPDNAADLLFDDVLWVSRAQAEHDAFADALRSRGVVVHYYGDLLTQTLEVAEARDYILDRVFDSRWHGPLAAATVARRGGRARLAEPGPVPGRRDHQAGDRRTRPGAEEHRVPLAGPGRLRARPAAEPALPARHLVLDLRRGVDQRDAPAGPDPGDRLRRGHLPLAPDVRRGTASTSGTTAPTRRRPPSRAATSWSSATGRCWPG